jgi:hypothetical protein
MIMVYIVNMEFSQYFNKNWLSFSIWWIDAILISIWWADGKYIDLNKTFHAS